MAYEAIKTELDEGVLIITLHRPERRNSFTIRMEKELEAAFDEADGNDDVRVVIVTGGGDYFCAGMELDPAHADFDRDYADEQAGRHRDSGGRLALRIYESRKPVIAAINGAAVGIGATMTLPMDIRIASTDAKMGFVFARRGIVTEAASSWFLPRIVGLPQALEWVMTGRVFDAEEAKRGGLVSKIVPPEALMDGARSLAREIADNTSAVAVTLCRHLLWRAHTAEHPMAAHRLDSQAIYHMFRSADAREGISSFLEKRRPDYPMKVSKDMPPFFPWWEEPPFEEK